MRTLTSRERALTAFACEIPDRVPVNYFGNSDIDRRLKAHFGLSVQDDEGLRQALGVDFRSIQPLYMGPRLHEDISESGIKVDNWGIRRRWVQHSSGGYWDYCDFPLKDADEDTIRNWPMPSPDYFDYTQIASLCRKNEEYASFFGGPGNVDIINGTSFLRGMEQVLVDIMINDAVGLQLIHRRFSILLEIASRTLEAAKGGVSFLWMGEDLGTQRGPTLSLDLYRRHIKPLHQQMIDLAKSYEIPVMIHSCGSSSWAFQDFIEMGINVVDTLQPEAHEMAPAYLKSTFGKKLAFHGCISTAGPLAYGSKEEVSQNCREILDIMKPDGGYCFAPTHDIQDNTPTENVLAMYETAKTFGYY